LTIRVQRIGALISTAARQSGVRAGLLVRRTGGPAPHRRTGRTRSGHRLRRTSSPECPTPSGRVSAATADATKITVVNANIPASPSQQARPPRHWITSMPGFLDLRETTVSVGRRHIPAGPAVNRPTATHRREPPSQETLRKVTAAAVKPRKHIRYSRIDHYARTRTAFARHDLCGSV
jgi:hypothetical protein